MNLFTKLFFLCFCCVLTSQDLTGKWTTIESENRDFYEELNLIATNYGEEYYGHSYDTESNGYCRYWLKATFNGLIFNAIENELIEKSFSHHPTIMQLNYSKVDSSEYLEGLVWIYTKSEIFGIQKSPSPNFVKLKKVSDTYTVFKPKENSGEKNDSIVSLIEKERLERARLKQLEEKRAKELLEIAELKELKNNRKNKEISKVTIRDQHRFYIDIWDFGEEDNDIVTIFLNDKILAKKIVISSKKKRFTVELDPDVKEYKLVFLANNLGNVPPNSAQVKIRYGSRQHNFKLFTDEKNNATITIKNRHSRK